MARNLNPADSPTAKAMDRAIDLAIEGNSPYPEHAVFADADSPHAGQEISRALDEGYAIVLVSPPGRERVITAETLTARRRWFLDAAIVPVTESVPGV
jgi:hypothetical protein